MGSQRPTFTYGRYYYGEEAVSGNQGNNIQYYRRETSGRINHHPPTDSLESRQISGLQADITHNGDNDMARSGSGSYTRNVLNIERPILNAPPRREFLGSASNTLGVYGYGSTTQSFQPHGAGYNGYGSHSQSMYGVGSPMMNASSHLNYLDGYGNAGMQQRRIINTPPLMHTFQSCTNGNGPAYGYGDVPGIQHRMINTPSPMHTFQSCTSGNGPAYGYGDVPIVQRRMISTPPPMHTYQPDDNGAPYDYNSVPVHEPNRPSPHFRGEFINRPVPSFTLESINSYENDPSLSNERSKLIARIKKCFEINAKDTFAKNSFLFDGQDWIKVSYTFSDGMKMYVAEMTCPICHGKVSPQNKEKEAGRLPKWDLYCVKRHVKALHCNKEDAMPHDSDAMPHNSDAMPHNSDAMPDQKSEPFTVPTNETVPQISSETSEPSDENSTEKAGKPSKESSSEGSSSDFPSSVLEGTTDSTHSDTDTKNVEKKTSKRVAKKCMRKKSSGQRKPETTSESEADIDTPEVRTKCTRKKCKGQRKTESTSQSENDAQGKTLNKQKKTCGKRRKIEKTVASENRSDKTKSEKSGNRGKKQSEKKESSSSDELEANISESDDSDAKWREPQVTYGWVKLTSKSRFQPAFIFPKRKGEDKQRAQYFQGNGKLSDLTHPVEQIATPAETEAARRSKKSQNYLVGIRRFNGRNRTDYA